MAINIDPKAYIFPSIDPTNSALSGYAAGAAAVRQPELNRQADTQFASQETLRQQAIARNTHNADRQPILDQQNDAEFAQKQQAKKNELAWLTEWKQDWADYADNPSDEKAARLMQKYPKLGKGMDAGHKLLNADQVSTRRRQLTQFAGLLSTGNQDAAEKLLADVLEAAQNSGDKKTEQEIGTISKILDGNDGAKNATAFVNLMLSNLNKDKKGSKAAHASKTTHYKDGSSSTTMSDGSRIVRDPAGTQVSGVDAKKVVAAGTSSGVVFAGDVSGAKERNKLAARIELKPSLERDVAAAKGEIELDLLKKKYKIEGDLKPEVAAKIVKAEQEAKIATARALGRETKIGLNEGTALASIPAMEASRDLVVKSVRELLAHPGLPLATGIWQGRVPEIVGGVLSEDFASFMSRFNQINGQAFASAFQTLKGGGQITEYESDQAKSAINRMNRATSEASFRAALKDFADNVEIGYNKLAQAAGIDPVKAKDEVVLRTVVRDGVTYEEYAAGKWRSVD